MSTLYRNAELFENLYFQKYPVCNTNQCFDKNWKKWQTITFFCNQGYYDTMDAGYKDEKGYIYVTARDDDVINVAGHRISTSSLEDAVLR